MHIKFTLALAALTLGLAACGDSPPDAPPAPVMPASADDVPVKATASSMAYTSFAASLPNSDTAQPLNISQTVPPTSETETPQPL
jgi:hypothetical protein